MVAGIHGPRYFPLRYNHIMPGEQYLALARAIKRPMRRWWLTVGSWWLGGTAVLLIVQAIMTVYEIQLELAENWNLLVNQPTWYQELENLIFQLPQIILIGAVLCSHKVAELVAQLCEGTPLAGDRVTTVSAFRLALLNCWPTLIPVLSTWLIYSFQMYFLRYGGLETLYRGIEMGFVIAMYYATPLLWVCVFAVLPSVPKWVSWLFYSCLIVLPPLLFLWYILRFTGIDPLFPSYKEIDLSGSLTVIGFAALSVISVIVLYFIVYLFCRRMQKYAILLASLVCVHIFLDSINASIGVFPLDLFIQCGSLYTESFAPIVLDTLGGNLRLFTFSVIMDFKFSWPAIGYALSIISYAFWLILHFYLLSWMIRRVKPRVMNPRPVHPVH